MILTCTNIANEWLTSLAETIKSESLKPRLGIVMVGANPATRTFVNKKLQAAKLINATVTLSELPDSPTTSTVQAAVSDLAKKCNGVIVQLPLPSDCDTSSILDSVPSNKDVDGLGRDQLARAVRHEHGFIPATVRGILHLLEHQKVALAGKRVLIVGAGQLVGRPLALALINHDASVLVADKEDEALAELSKLADVIVTATGVHGTLKAEHVHKGQLILDAGFSMAGKKIQGDADTAAIDAAGATITPVPGGIGALTVAALFANLVDAVLEQRA